MVKILIEHVTVVSALWMEKGNLVEWSYLGKPKSNTSAGVEELIFLSRGCCWGTKNKMKWCTVEGVLNSTKRREGDEHNSNAVTVLFFGWSNPEKSWHVQLWRCLKFARGKL